MKRFMFKIKKIAAVCVLSMLVACSLSPAVKASNSFYKYGCRNYPVGKYQSYTLIRCYDEKGYGISVGAAANIGTGWSKDFGVGSVPCSSDMSSTKRDATHAWGYNKSIDLNTVWTAN